MIKKNKKWQKVQLSSGVLCNVFLLSYGIVIVTSAKMYEVVNG